MMSTESIKKALKSLNCYDKWDVKKNRTWLFSLL